MAQRHEGILARLSPEARRALVNTPEGGYVALPPGPAREAVRQELESVVGGPLVRAANMAATSVMLNFRGEVVRHYAMIQALEDLG
jgi:hypothetical protein